MKINWYYAALCSWAIAMLIITVTSPPSPDPLGASFCGAAAVLWAFAAIHQRDPRS